MLLASGAFAVELAASGRRADFFNVLAWMALVHAAIGIGEALITGLVLRFLLLVRPDLIEDDDPKGSSSTRRWGQVAVGGLGVALAVAVFLAPFASEYDDGLEWVGGKLGFLKEEKPVLAAPIPDYQLSLPGLSYVPVATALAGAVGTLIVFGAGFGLARVFSRKTTTVTGADVRDGAFPAHRSANAPTRHRGCPGPRIAGGTWLRLQPYCQRTRAPRRGSSERPPQQQEQLRSLPRAPGAHSLYIR